MKPLWPKLVQKPDNGIFAGVSGTQWKLQGREEMPGVEEVMPGGPGCNLVDPDGRPGLSLLTWMGPKPFLPTCS